MMTTPKFRIYKDVICLEMPSRTGHKWWDQGFTLGYTPWLVSGINKVRYGQLHGDRRPVLAAEIPIAGVMQWVAVNLPRSDLTALQRRGLWHLNINAPYTETPSYVDFPEKL